MEERVISVRADVRAYSRFAAWSMLGIFLLLYLLSFADRTIINLLVVPIEADTHISDWTMSLLIGPAFGVFYAICGIPLGWLADRVSRPLMIFCGAVFWGLSTIFCGIGGTVGALLVGRIGVALGEAVLTPAAQSQIADRFSKDRLATAQAIYSSGAVLGIGLTAITGGFLANYAGHHPAIPVAVIGSLHPWQVVLCALGIVTAVAAPLSLLVREPSERRRRSLTASGTGSLWSIVVKEPWIFVGLPAGFALSYAAAKAYDTWLPTLLVRQFGWNIAKVGLFYGSQHILAGLMGQIGAAYLVDVLYSRRVKDAHTKFQVIALLITAPLAIIGLLVGNPWLLLLLTVPIYAACFSFGGYAIAALQIFAPSHLRSQVSALYLLMITIGGLGAGPTFTAFLSDRVFHDKAALAPALSVATVVFGILSVATLLVVGLRTRRLHAQIEASAANAGNA